MSDTPPDTDPDRPDRPDRTPSDGATNADDTPSRRRLLGVLAGLLGGLLGLAAAVGPLGVVLDPLLRRRAAPDAGGPEGRGWTSVGPVDRFPVGGPPARVVLKEDRVDAWLREPGVSVGSVLVARLGPEAFRVFSARCPHLGCAVAFRPGADHFVCPCHKSTFALDGALRPHTDGGKNPSPRGLDPLAWRVAHGHLQVRWVRYRTGSAERVPVA